MWHRWAIATARTPTKEVSIVTGPSVNGAPVAAMRQWPPGWRHTKSPVRGTGQTRTGSDAEAPGSGAEAGGFDQAHLIAPGGEFPTLVALDHDPTSGLDPDHPGPDPAKSG